MIEYMKSVANDYDLDVILCPYLHMHLLKPKHSELASCMVYHSIMNEPTNFVNYCAVFNQGHLPSREGVFMSRIVHTDHNSDVALLAIALRKSLRFSTYDGAFALYINNVLHNPIYMPRVALCRMLSNPISGFVKSKQDVDAFIGALDEYYN